MKILHIINNLSSGGAERLLVDLLPGLRDRGQDVTLLLLSSKNMKSNYLDNLQSSYINVYILSQKISLYNPYIAFLLFLFLNKNKYDVIHVHLFPAQYWTAFALLFIKYKPFTVFTEHCASNGRMGKWYFHYIEELVYKKYDKIIVISESVNSSICRWVNVAKRCVLIKNGVNLEAINSAPKISITNLIDGCFFKDDSIFLLMAARFNQQKDHLTLIKAFQLLPSNYILLLAGEGALVDKCKKICCSLNIDDRVYFLGYREDIYSIMKSVNLNILSSHYEGFSGVALEMLASGVPFLGSNVDGINDIVDFPESLFTCGDISDLSSKIICLTNNENIIDTQREKNRIIVSAYDMSIMHNNYFLFYESFTYKYK